MPAHRFRIGRRATPPCGRSYRADLLDSDRLESRRSPAGGSAPASRSTAIIRAAISRLLPDPACCSVVNSQWWNRLTGRDGSPEASHLCSTKHRGAFGESVARCSPLKTIVQQACRAPLPGRVATHRDLSGGCRDHPDARDQPPWGPVIAPNSMAAPALCNLCNCCTACWKTP